MEIGKGLAPQMPECAGDARAPGIKARRSADTVKFCAACLTVQSLVVCDNLQYPTLMKLTRTCSAKQPVVTGCLRKVYCLPKKAPPGAFGLPERVS